MNLQIPGPEGSLKGAGATHPTKATRSAEVASCDGGSEGAGQSSGWLAVWRDTSGTGNGSGNGHAVPGPDGVPEAEQSGAEGKYSSAEGASRHAMTDVDEWIGTAAPLPTLPPLASEPAPAAGPPESAPWLLAGSALPQTGNGLPVHHPGFLSSALSRVLGGPPLWVGTVLHGGINGALVAASPMSAAAADPGAMDGLRTEGRSVVSETHMASTGTVSERGTMSAASESVQTNLPPGVRTPPGTLADTAALRVQWMLRNGEQQAMLQLNPRQLGAMELRVRLDADTAHVQVTVQPQARELLEQALPRLRESLADAGLANLQLDLQTRSDDRDRAPGSESGFGSVSAEGAADAEPDVLPAAAARDLSDRLLDLYA